MMTISFTVIGLVITLWLYGAYTTAHLFIKSLYVKSESRKKSIRRTAIYDFIVVMIITIVLLLLVAIVKYLP